MISKAEAPLKVPLGDAAMQVFARFLGRRLPPRNHERVLAKLDLEILLSKSGHGKLDPKRIVRDMLNIERRISRSFILAHRLIKQAIDTIEANNRPVELS